MSGTTVLTTVSWEERFLIGLEKLIGSESPDSVVLFRYDIRTDWTSERTADAVELCERSGCSVRTVLLSYTDGGVTWRVLRDEIAAIRTAKRQVVVDISTMARETMWSLMLLLSESRVGGRYIYSRPADYGDWISRDPGRPRLAVKLGGEMEFGRETMLLIVTGFDWERTAQLIRTFDPAMVRLAIQEGDQFGNETRNRTAHEVHFLGAERKRRDLGMVDIDAYDDDHGYEVIRDVVEECSGRYNVLMASLGPKPSAIALYRVQRLVPASGLVYSPANEYSHGYSKGVAHVIGGRLPGVE